MEKAEEGFHTRGGAVFADGGALGDVGVSDVASAAEVGFFFFGQHGQNTLHRLGLHGCADVVERGGVEVGRGGQSAFDEVVADAKF